MKNIQSLNFINWPGWLQCLMVTTLALLLYSPIIGNTFLSDDWLVLKKLVIDKELNMEGGFFRPLSDITIWLTWKLFGLNPLPYYLTGILLHAINTLLIYHCCLRWQWTSHSPTLQLFAAIAALLFLTYPFHNESMAWIVGRGALMAGTCGFLALYILIGPYSNIVKIAGVCICYFTGLLAYESVIVLPAMVLLYLFVQRSGSRNIINWCLALGITLLAHLLMRFWVAGSVTGDYGSDFFNVSFRGYFLNMFKSFGRILLPPRDNAGFMVMASLILFVLLIAAGIQLVKKIKHNKQAGKFAALQLSFFVIAMIIPVVAGISTRTTESDRFLHFPSYFFCILVAFFLVNLCTNYRFLLFAVAGVLCYQVYFLEVNNRNWQKASAAVKNILHIASKTAGQELYIVNLPEEIDGAYVFRNGFTEALLVNTIDTAAVTVVSRLKRNDMPAIPQPVVNARLVYWDTKRWVER